jgi:hypothetical protein
MLEFLQLFNFLLVLVFNLLWIIKYPEELLETALFMVGSIKYSLVYWVFNLLGIIQLMLYLYE